MASLRLAPKVRDDPVTEVPFMPVQSNADGLESLLDIGGVCGYCPSMILRTELTKSFDKPKI